MTTAEEMRERFYSLYNTMANSHEVAYMRTFGNVHKEMMEWMIANKPEAAKDWIEKLEAINWKNYLTHKESEIIISNMNPKAPWSKEQWKNAMIQNGLELEYVPYYNSCSLWVTMSMIMSDSSETLKKYIDEGNLFKAVYELAIDKLTDKDGVFCIRSYFGL